MRFIVALVALTATSLMTAEQALADVDDSIRDSLHIVVDTGTEGIHYAHGCAFYQLRGLLADGLENRTGSITTTGDVVFEVHILGKSGQIAAQLGDHWIAVGGLVSLLPDSTYSRILELVHRREGHGVNKARLAPSIATALANIQSPNYVEENRCDGTRENF